MKSIKRIVFAFTIAVVGLTSVTAQEETESNWSTGLDIASTYVWRGTAYAGTSIQPYVEYSVGGFAIGAWGSQGLDGLFSASNGYQEMDLYAGYGFDFGLYLGVTDYYYPPSLLFDGDNHAVEINASFELGSLSLAANYIVNLDSDLYFELGYGFDNGLSVFAGAGDGWHTSDGEFMVCNVGMSYGKEVKITDSWSLPIGGSVIVNPETEQFFIVGTISF